ncbi:hypothetical protein HK105_209262 [Polyrhizophydium stewartii]|uniref:ubiquitinyl hydrolase 1 n=1 Tax=Polyrhizophydium stewartii TaxID=2732419 RepID=A0ABR4MVJ0_9FUNG
MYLKEPGCHSCKSKSKPASGVAAGLASLVAREIAHPDPKSSGADLLARSAASVGASLSGSLPEPDAPGAAAASASASAAPGAAPLQHTGDPAAKQIWICLCCAKLSCGSETQDHVRGHAIKRQHHLVMNIDTSDGWCYACSGDIVGENGNNKVVLEARRILEKHHRPSKQANADSRVLLQSSLSASTAGSLICASKKGRPAQVRNPGLTNLGNTCFFNSVMQCLTFSQQLCKFVPAQESSLPLSSIEPAPARLDAAGAGALNAGSMPNLLSKGSLSGVTFGSDPSSLKSPVTSQDLLVPANQAAAASATSTTPPLPPPPPPMRVIVSSDTPLTQAFSRFLRSIRRELVSQSPQSVNPRELFGEISRQWDSYSSYRQQDSHELLRRLLDGIKEEQYANDAKGKVISYRQQTFVDEVFGGRMASIVVCDTVKHPSLSFEDFLDVSLSISKVLTERRASMRTFLTTVMKPRNRMVSPVPPKRDLLPPPPALKLSDSASSNGSDKEPADKTGQDSAGRRMLTKGLERLRLSPRRGPVIPEKLLTTPASNPSSSLSPSAATTPALASAAPRDDGSQPGSQLPSAVPSAVPSAAPSAAPSEAGGSAPSSPFTKAMQAIPVPRSDEAPPLTDLQRLAIMQSLLRQIDPADLVPADFTRSRSASGGSGGGLGNGAAGASVTLARCLADYFGVELLDGENGLHCDNCYKLKYGDEDDPVPQPLQLGSQPRSHAVPLSLQSQVPGSPIKASTIEVIMEPPLPLPMAQTASAASGAAHFGKSVDSLPLTTPSDLETDDGATPSDGGHSAGNTLGRHPRLQTAEPVGDNASDGGGASAAGAGGSGGEGGSSASSLTDSDSDVQDLGVTIPVEPPPKPAAAKPAAKAKKHPPCVSRAYKRFMLFGAPNTLVLHFKRFEQIGSTGRTRKVDAVVPFDEWIDLDEAMAPPKVVEEAPKPVGGAMIAAASGGQAPTPALLGEPASRPVSPVAVAAAAASDTASVSSLATAATSATRPTLMSIPEFVAIASAVGSVSNASSLAAADAIAHAHVPPPPRRSGGRYWLNAVVVHSGSIFGGHHIAYVRVPGLSRLAPFGDGIATPTPSATVSASAAVSASPIACASAPASASATAAVPQPQSSSTPTTGSATTGPLAAASTAGAAAGASAAMDLTLAVAAAAEGTWAYCSDSAVRPATLEAVLKCQAYILLYERIGE